eukprot:gene4895-5364_t
MTTLKTFLNELESIPSFKSNNSSSIILQTLSSSENGEIFVLSEKEEILRGHLHHTASTTSTTTGTGTTTTPATTREVLQAIPIRSKVNNEQVSLAGYHHIVSNGDGSLLALWSVDGKVAVLEAPPNQQTTMRNTVEEGSEKGCHYLYRPLTPLESYTDHSYSNTNSSNTSQKFHRLAEVTFHPLSPYTLVLLYESRYLVVCNLADDSMEGQQVYPLPATLSFQGMAFGPPMEWLRFTIFLLSKAGDIYALCPIIPKNIVLPRVIANELWSWLREKENKSLEDNIEEYDSKQKDYLSLVRTCLTTYFGNEELMEEEDLDGVNRSYLLTANVNFSQNQDNEEWDVSYANKLSSYHVALQGPLRRYAEKGTSPTSPVVDIAVPKAKGLATEGGAPILFLAHACGSVEVALLDLEAESSGYINPAWKALDLSIPNLQPMVSDLLVADTFFLTDSDKGNISNNRWKIIPDPAYSHCIHLINFQQGNAYMLWSTWLEKMSRKARNAPSQSTFSPFDSPSNGGGGLMGEEKTFDQFDSEEDQEEEGESHKGNKVMLTFDSQKDFAVDGRKVSTDLALSGAVILLDPFLGHAAIFRMTSNSVIAVNLSVHLKLCDLQLSILQQQQVTGKRTSRKESSLKRELYDMTKDETLRLNQDRALMIKIAQGLTQMPVVEMAVSSENPRKEVPGKSFAEQKKLLIETAQTLDKDVVAPLHELGQSTLFHYNLVQERYKTQREIIEGKDGGHSSASSSSSSTVKLSQHGLKRILQSLRREEEELKERVQDLYNRYDNIRDHADRCLNLVLNLRKKVTPGEKLFRSQLKEWSKVVSTMSGEVDHLKVLTAKRYHAAPSNADQSTSFGGTGLSPIRNARSTAFPPSPQIFQPSTSFISPVKTQTGMSFMMRRSLLGTSSSSGGGAAPQPPSTPFSPTTPGAAVATPVKKEDVSTASQPGGIVLNEEDVRCCLEILQEQGRKLAAFKRQALLVEKKVKDAMQQQVNNVEESVGGVEM